MTSTSALLWVAIYISIDAIARLFVITSAAYPRQKKRWEDIIDTLCNVAVVTAIFLVLSQVPA